MRVEMDNLLDQKGRKRKCVTKNLFFMELAARATSGQGTLGCISGNSPDPYGFVCKAGAAGSDLALDCVSGSTAGAGNSRITGPSADVECGSGGSASYGGSCDAGPSFV